MPFPVVKLAYLAVRQISKPIANMLKREAKEHPNLRKYILIPPGQLYHRLETGIRMRLKGLKLSADVKPLSDEMAVELGADMLGEVVVYSVAVMTIFLEYRRQANSAAHHESSQNTKLLQLEQTVTDIGLKLEEHSAQMRELTRLIHSQPLPEKIVDYKSGTELKVKKPETIVDRKSGTVLTVKT